MSGQGGAPYHRTIRTPEVIPHPDLIKVDPKGPSTLIIRYLGLAGSMFGILYTFWGMGFLISMKKGSFFLPRVMWAKVG